MYMKKTWIVILTFAFICSVFLNLHLLTPSRTRETISPGLYINWMDNGQRYALSVFFDNSIIVYNPFDEIILEGELIFIEEENHYRVVTESNTFQVAVSDDTIFLPITDGDIIVSKLFVRAEEGPMTISQR